MKFNVNINQKALAEQPDDYDLTDGGLLDFFWYYCNSKNPKIASKRIEEEGEIYTWVDYGMITKEMPLIKIKSKAGISKRIKRLEELSWVKTMRPENQKVYIALTAKFEELLTDVNGAVNRSKQSRKPQLTNHSNNNHSNNNQESSQNHRAKEYKAAKVKFTDNDVKLARLLDKKIKENYPVLADKLTNIDQWADDIRKLREIDGAKSNQIELMIYWVHGGVFNRPNGDIKFKEHDFWSQNIQSASKLREQFYKNLYPQIKKDLEEKVQKNSVVKM